MHTRAYVNHTLIISPQFRTLEMTVRPSLCFVQPHSLMMGQWGPKHVGATRRRVTPRVWDYLKSATFSSDLCSVSYLGGAILSCILMTPDHMHSFLRLFPVRRATSVLNQHHRVPCFDTSTLATAPIFRWQAVYAAVQWRTGVNIGRITDRCHCTNYISCHKAVWVLLRKGSRYGASTMYVFNKQNASTTDAVRTLSS